MQIKAGQKLEQDFVVEEKHTAFHIGSGSVQVLATPIMIAFIEITALKLLNQSLDEGYSSVGTRVDIRHLAPSPLGHHVRVQVVVEQVEGQKVTLQVEVWDGDTLVGAGTHERFVIDVARFLERVQKLAERGS
jgi:fluoroacetyl-CoA thioesterase